MWYTRIYREYGRKLLCCREISIGDKINFSKGGFRYEINEKH